MNLLTLQAFDIDVWRTTGTKVCTVGGQDVKQLTVFEIGGDTVLYGVVCDSEIRNWSVDGVSFNHPRLNLMMEIPQVKKYVAVYYNTLTHKLWCSDVHECKIACTPLRPAAPNLVVISVIEFEHDASLKIEN